jgi:hypothetical protein
VEWGQRGGVAVADILDQIKTTADGAEAGEERAEGEKKPEGEQKPEGEAEVVEEVRPATKSPASSGSSLSPAPSEAPPDAPPAKRQKEMTLEEYEAMLDDDFDAELYNIP